jgi:hypothetical protein
LPTKHRRRRSCHAQSGLALDDAVASRHRLTVGNGDIHHWLRIDPRANNAHRRFRTVGNLDSGRRHDQRSASEPQAADAHAFVSVTRFRNHNRRPAIFVDLSAVWLVVYLVNTFGSFCDSANFFQKLRRSLFVSFMPAVMFSFFVAVSAARSVVDAPVIEFPPAGSPVAV